MCKYFLGTFYRHTLRSFHMKQHPRSPITWLVIQSFLHSKLHIRWFASKSIAKCLLLILVKLSYLDDGILCGSVSILAEHVVAMDAFNDHAFVLPRSWTHSAAIKFGLSSFP